MCSILDYTVSIGITSFNRPEYLSRCLKSLEKQTDLDDVEFILAQDGPCWAGELRCPQVLIDECVKMFNSSSLPNKSSMVSEKNLGIPFNHKRLYDECFDIRNRRSMILSEDDIVYNPDWLRVTKILMRQFQDDSSVATVQASCRSGRMDNTKRELDYNIVKFGKPNWLGFAIWKDRWERMRPFFNTYLDVVASEADYSHRNHARIREWYTGTLNLDEGMTSQDRAKEWACVLSGMGRVYTAVNRAIYIGENGVHGNADNYKAGGYGEMVNDRIQGDLTLDKFVIGGRFADPSDYARICAKEKRMPEDND